MEKGLEIKPFERIKTLSSEEAQELEEAWENVLFSKAQFRSKKEGILEALSVRYPSQVGEDATRSYDMHSSLDYVVLDLSPARKGAAISSAKPQEVSCEDFCIFPPNMAWIYACTHEGDWWGPFFAKHPQYEKLNLRNELDIKKTVEIERAKRRGWL